MRFSAVVLIVPEEDENRAVDILKEAGATGMTILKGKGLRQNDRKTFLGLGLERKESLLLCVVEKQLAMRILKASGVTLRRTVRIGLWNGEEQGLIGSRDYVAKHFAGRAAPPPATPGAAPVAAAPGESACPCRRRCRN